jgi:hypothetical protein
MKKKGVRGGLQRERESERERERERTHPDLLLLLIVNLSQFIFSNLLI